MQIDEIIAQWKPEELMDYLVIVLGFPGDSALELSHQGSYGLCEAEPEPAFVNMLFCEIK